MGRAHLISFPPKALPILQERRLKPENEGQHSVGGWARGHNWVGPRRAAKNPPCLHSGRPQGSDSVAHPLLPQEAL